MSRSLSVIAMYLCFSHIDCVLVMKVVSHGLLFSQSGALEVVYRSCVTDVEKQRWRVFLFSCVSVVVTEVALS